MDCGIPYCHNGCPVNNLIPDWNHLVYEEDWKRALDMLHTTNNFPEFTGRICPAPCEGGLHIEHHRPAGDHQVDRMRHHRSRMEGRLGHPAGASEEDRQIGRGGRLRPGRARLRPATRARGAQRHRVSKSPTVSAACCVTASPTSRWKKHLINRRCQQMEAEGVTFKTSKEVGVDISFKSLQENFDAVVLAGGAEDARPLSIPGAEMPGVRMGDGIPDPAEQACWRAMTNCAPHRAGACSPPESTWWCWAEAIRGATASAHRTGRARKASPQLEIMPKPPEKEDKALTWPDWPMKLRTSSSHQEGVERDWAVLAKRVIGDGEAVTGLECVRVEWVGGQMQEIAGERIRNPGRSDPARHGLCRAEEGWIA